MAWIWRYEDADGQALDGLEPEAFTSRGDAESWIGEAWRDLAEDGVHQVTLLDGDRVVFGPMRLSED